MIGAAISNILIPSMRSFALGLALLAVVFAFSCADRLAEYYPLAVGNRWVYRTTYHDTGEVKRQTDEIVHRFENSYQLSSGTHIVHLKNNSFMDSSGVILTYPIEEGHSWRLGGKSARYTSVDKTVAVPAGTFHHCLEVLIEEKRDGALFFATIAYAPGVGPVKMEYVKIEGGERTPLFTSELVEYHINPKGKPTGCW